MGRCGICGKTPRGGEAECAGCGAPLRRDHGIELGTPDIPVRRFGSVPLPPEELFAAADDRRPAPGGAVAAAAALRRALGRTLARWRKPAGRANPPARRR